MACNPYTYTYSKACPYPNYGVYTPKNPKSISLTHNSFVHHILGTSLFSNLLNLSLLIVILTAIFIFVVLPLVHLILDILDFRHLKERQTIFLELTPPAYSTKTPLASTQLYIAINGLLSSNSSKGQLLKRKHLMALELVADRTSGIRFIAIIDPSDELIFRQQLATHLSAVQVKEVEDYLMPGGSSQSLRIADFKQAGHFAYRLATHESLNQHDPIAEVMNSMAKPSTNELTAYQLVFSPADQRRIGKVRAKLMYGQDPGMNRSWWHYPFILTFKLLRTAIGIFKFVLEIVSDEVTGIRNSRPLPSGYGTPAISPITQHVLPAVHSKLDEPLFEVSIRVLVTGEDGTQRMRGLTNSLHQFHVPGFQGLVCRRIWPNKYMLPHSLESFEYRLPAMLTRNSNILAASELAALYHFPYGETSQTEDVAKSMAKTLPAPLPMKRHEDNASYDVSLGINHHHGSDTLLGLTAKEREKHAYIVGTTGSGKTTMLEYAALQDIKAGKGLAFIDPHGDAAQKLLKYIPEDRINDVVYLNPIDIKYPIGINLLELPEGLDEDDLLLEKERVTEAVISVLRKVFADDEANAHRIEAMLRNAIHTAFTIPGANLFTILKLFRNVAYRNKVVAKLDDQYLIDFWKEEFAQAGSMQRVSMSKGVNYRIDRFRSSAPASRMLEQAKSTISFEDIIDRGKILICNLSTEMGEDTSTLFGTTVLAKLKIAAERRARMPEDERRPFYVYVDEFQNFATTPFVKMLSASRKYRLFLTIAQQSTNQQDEQRLTEAILSNISTLICFSLGSPADERLLLQRFTPQVEKGELTNLSAHTFYLKVKAEESLDPVSGETIVLDKQIASDDKAEQVIAASRRNYAVRYIRPEPDETLQAEAKNSTKVNKKRLSNKIGGVSKPALRHRKNAINEQ